MTRQSDFIYAAIAGVVVFALWVLVVEMLIYMRAPVPLGLGLSVALNAALITVLLRRR